MQYAPLHNIHHLMRSRETTISKYWDGSISRWTTVRACCKQTKFYSDLKTSRKAYETIYFVRPEPSLGARKNKRRALERPEDKTRKEDF